MDDVTWVKHLKFPHLRALSTSAHWCGRSTRPSSLRVSKLFCTRADGHFGRHAAGDGKIILAVWPNEKEKPSV